MLNPTADEIKKAEVRARQRIAVRIVASLPLLGHGETVTHALSAPRVREAGGRHLAVKGPAWRISPSQRLRSKIMRDT